MIDIPNLEALDVAALTSLQRRLVYEVSGEPDTAAVIFCEHPPGITLGRDGSRVHIRWTDAELVAKKLPLDWVARGGGAMLHTPGQIACYPILPLDSWGISPADYVRHLIDTVVEVASDFDIPAEPDYPNVTVRVRGRRIVHIGAAVRNGVSLFGLVLNVDPDLEDFRELDCDCDGDPLPMTSLQRESTSRVRFHTVAKGLLENLAGRFGLSLPTFPPRQALNVLYLKRYAFPQRDR